MHRKCVKSMWEKSDEFYSASKWVSLAKLKRRGFLQDRLYLHSVSCYMYSSVKMLWLSVRTNNSNIFNSFL